MGNYKLISLNRVDSTQTYAQKMINQGMARDAVAVCADMQTAGRGRMTRQWVSASGNLYVSFIYHAPRRDARLAYAVAVAVVDVIESMGIAARIKWPNDILIDGAKVCGILIEYSGDWVIVGIGVNIQSCPKVQKYQTTCLARYASVTRDEFLKKLMLAMDVWRGAEFNQVREKWMAHAIGLDSSVMYRGVLSIMRGIDENGALILEQNGVKVAVYGDEINL